MTEKMTQPEDRLTDTERSCLKLAREYTREVHALEHYNHLWEELDRRLGSSNDLTARFFREYQERVFERPLDRYESQRVDLMRTSFVFPRTDMPEDVRRALLFYSAFNKR